MRQGKRRGSALTEARTAVEPAVISKGGSDARED